MAKQLTNPNSEDPGAPVSPVEDYAAGRVIQNTRTWIGLEAGRRRSKGDYHGADAIGAVDDFIAAELERNELARNATSKAISRAGQGLPPRDRAHVSNALAILNQAAEKWWGNASQEEADTHPDKKEVVAWLVERGFTESLAAKGATIIRPPWAFVGRKSKQ